MISNLEKEWAALLSLLLMTVCVSAESQLSINEAVPATESTATAALPDFETDVRPILENRCVVCHSCYDAPCQLKMESFAGIARGASKDVVYNGARVSAAKPTRLGIDARSQSAWRALAFHDVLAQSQSQDEAGRNSLLSKFLDLKQRNPLPSGCVFHTSLKRSASGWRPTNS